MKDGKKKPILHLLINILSFLHKINAVFSYHNLKCKDIILKTPALTKIQIDVSENVIKSKH